MDIIYPLKKSAWDKEILFSLRSIDMYFKSPCQIHICGDYLPEWITGVEYHAFNRSADKTTEQNIAIILEWACQQFHEFIWMNDDIYFLKDSDVNDLLPHPTLGNLSQVNIRKTGRWAKLLWDTFDLLSEAGFSPIWNFSTHTPSLYNSKQMLACAEQFPLFTGELLFEIVYYNIFRHKTPPKLQNKAGFYRKKLPVDLENQNYRFLNHDDRGLSADLKQAIVNKFNVKSIYER